MLAVLDTLGNHPQAQDVPESDDGGDDGLVLGIGAQPANEGSVDLQRVHGQMLQVAQRRIAGSEVINRQAQSDVAQLGFGMARMYAMLREEEGGAVRVFRDYDEARSWVESGDP